MRISTINKLNFKRQLRADEISEFSAVLKQGKEKLGNTGHSILIVPSASLPQAINTGVGNMLDDEGRKFFDFAKEYWGINYVQLLPEGQYKPVGGSYFPYSGSALDLGTHLINTELLTTEEYGKLLSKEDISKLVEANNHLRKDSRVNFENVLSRQSATEKTLRKAYDELIKADTLTKRELLKNIEKYTETNKDWLEPKSVFEALSSKYKSFDTRCWNEFDQNFYNTDVVPLKKRLSAIEGIKRSELSKEMKFYEFKQYLADMHLAKAKQELNKKGIKLSGDVLAGFSYNEVWANPKAFVKDSSIGWGLYALDYEKPEAEKLLRTKIRNYAKRYDGLRLDASWAYVRQPIENNFTKEKIYKEHGSKILEIIEDEILKVKGKNYNLENIMHEFAANPKDFNLFDGIEIKPLGRDRIKIYSSFNLSEDWGTVSAFRNRGWKDGSYILGVSNHDSYPLKVEYENLVKRAEQSKVLADILKIPKNKLNSYSEFVQAKFAEPMRSKHNMFFFTELLGISKRYKHPKNNPEDYRIKIPKDYQTEYFKALEKGEGFNVMDALDKAFVAEGLDKKEPELYKKIVKYKKILQSSENKFSKKKIVILLLAAKLVLAGVYLIYRKNKKKAGNADSNAQKI